MNLLLIIALAGLVLSATAHLATFVGIYPQKVFPAIWLLHIGIFVVWIPTVIISKKSEAWKNFTNKSGRNDAWKEALKYAPAWMKLLCTVLFAYALFNFFFTIFALNQGGVPGRINGEKVLHSHGKIIRKLTDEEYERHEAYTIRTFSGHWMLFYGLATTVLLSECRRRSRKQ